MIGGAEMNYSKIRECLATYYQNNADENAQRLKTKVYDILDSEYECAPDCGAYRMKAMQYRVISENIEPVIFPELPFYFETGALTGFSNGLYNRRGAEHANGWTIEKNYHFFIDNNPKAYERLKNNGMTFTICGPFVDFQHYPIPLRKLFAGGLKSVMAEAIEAKVRAKTREEGEFIDTAIAGLTALKTIADKFSKTATALLELETDASKRENLIRMRDTAKKIPWNKPESIYEGLCAMAFMRKALGSIEGVGFNSFGRVDLLLAECYENDRKRGVSDDEIFDLLCGFILIWDSHLDRSKQMAGNLDYELENTLTIGGCDPDGNTVYNGVTRLLVKAYRSLNAIYPKLMCRYSAVSPDEYLTLIGGPTFAGQSVILYENDDAVIPALIRHGFEPAVARDYCISGCWDIQLNDYTKRNGGGYINALRAVEWAVHQPLDQFRELDMYFKPIEGCSSFDEVYDSILQNILMIIRRKAVLTAEGARIWHKVAPVCTVSALFFDPLKNLKDFSNGGTGHKAYNWETFYITGFPDVIDSLLAIKYLCFDKKLCSLSELVTECKNNWPNEALRRRMIAEVPHYCDGSDETAKLVGRLNDDIYELSRGLPTAFGGEYSVGHLIYTEIIWWGKRMAATPNGRHNGDYITHGLAPTHLHSINSLTDVFEGLKEFDFGKCAGNTILNINVNLGGDEGLFVNLLRATARLGIQALHINNVSREELLAAQKEPENHGDIIVRVCGFSAQFTALSKEYQNEFLDRSFYR